MFFREVSFLSSRFMVQYDFSVETQSEGSVVKVKKYKLKNMRSLAFTYCNKFVN